MFDIQHYASFIAAILIFQMIPGPGTLAILGATARSGVSGGMGVVFGTVSGDFVYMLAAVLGLAAILTAYPTVFAAMQWFGISYLCWIGFKLLTEPVTDTAASDTKRHSAWYFFRQGFTVALTNPKAIMFFMAFFPLFVRPDARPITLVSMMVHVTLTCLLYQIGLVLIGNLAARLLSGVPGVRTIANRLAGLALIGFGLKLALDDR
ncbi:MAG: LysE family translocator [Proteobacteria bacterium]|nr:LysE family translocator [Pseudomonadota bacterium]